MTNIKSSEITSEELYHKRREFLIGMGGLGLAASMNGFAASASANSRLPAFKAGTNNTGESLTSFDNITTYNNFYEFGTDKGDPARNAHSLLTRPWTISLEGEIKRPLRMDMDDLMRRFPLEERIYRFRCVEAWSMVIPWVGFPLSRLIQLAEPTRNAKFVEFVSLADPNTMPGVKRPVLDWPYTEGLRMDEAMHPLTLLAVGLYGQVLPNQNGAPIRLVVPWKYGFKNIKSVVRIRFRETMPTSTWTRANAAEYGFYSNVNPEVDHPRWSQATERRIGAGLFEARHKTLPFNGYAEQVAQLYSGMDLRKFF